MAELLAVLYRKILRVSPATVDDPDRDRFILSKGHSLRRGLCGAGRVRLFSPGVAGELLPERRPPRRTHHRRRHPGRGGFHRLRWGMGCPSPAAWRWPAGAMAGPTGSSPCSATASATKARPGRPCSLPAHHARKTWWPIVDYNKIQSLGHCKDVLRLDPFAAKWPSFGWAACEIDGHDVAAVEAALAKRAAQAGSPPA